MKIDYYQGILFSCIYQVGHIVAFTYTYSSDTTIKVTQLIPLSSTSDIANYEPFNTDEYLGIVCSNISEDTILSVNHDSLLCVTPVNVNLINLSSPVPMKNRKIVSTEKIEFNQYGWSLFEKFSDRVRCSNKTLIKLIDMLKKSSIKDLGLVNLVDSVDVKVFDKEIHKAKLSKEEIDSMIQILTTTHSDNASNLISIIYKNEINN